MNLNLSSHHIISPLHPALCCVTSAQPCSFRMVRIVEITLPDSIYSRGISYDSTSNLSVDSLEAGHFNTSVLRHDTETAIYTTADQSNVSWHFGEFMTTRLQALTQRFQAPQDLPNYTRTAGYR